MKGRKVHGILVADYSLLTKRIRESAQFSREPGKADGMMFSAFTQALEQAKKDRDGFGWSASGDVLSTVNLDETGKRLLHAEFYIREADYRDEELFKEASN